MATTTLEKHAPATRKPANPADLSEAIEQVVERRARERVQCVRVYGDKYRVNWWVGGDIGLAGRIVKSRFLSVTWNQHGALDIQDVTG